MTAPATLRIRQHTMVGVSHAAVGMRWWSEIVLPPRKQRPGGPPVPLKPLPEVYEDWSMTRASAIRKARRWLRRDHGITELVVVDLPAVAGIHGDVERR